MLEKKPSVLPNPTQTRNSKGWFEKTLTCKRGHDRKLSRVGEDCIVCDRERKRGYQRTLEYKYIRNKRNLNRRIQEKRDKIKELERALYEENCRRDGAC